MGNPFQVRWLEGWSFQTVLMEGHVQVEAHGFGICLRTPVLVGETPVAAADRLVLAEDRRRHSLHKAWLKGQRAALAETAPKLEGASAVTAPDALELTFGSVERADANPDQADQRLSVGRKDADQPQADPDPSEENIDLPLGMVYQRLVRTSMMGT